MYTALSKRRENIAEYILYLWQLEDLIRALQFSPEAVYSQLVKPRGLEPEEEHQMLVWYMDIAELLRSEGKEEAGHMEHTLHLVADLQRLHDQLLELPVGGNYRALYTRLAPELPGLRGITGKEDISDIELCFRALYGAILYRIKGGEEAEKVSMDVVELVSPVIAELAAAYRRIESGETDLFAKD